MAANHFFVSPEVEETWGENDLECAELCTLMINRMVSSLMYIGPIHTQHIMSALISTYLTGMLDLVGEEALRTSLTAMVEQLPAMAKRLTERSIGDAQVH
jgi:hypothetical protein